MIVRAARHSRPEGPGSYKIKGIIINLHTYVCYVCYRIPVTSSLIIIICIINMTIIINIIISVLVEGRTPFKARGARKI